MLRRSTFGLTAVTVLAASPLTGCPSGGRLENGSEQAELFRCPQPQELIETNCAGAACHSPRVDRTPSARGGVVLTSAEGLAAMIDAPPTKTLDCESSSLKLVDTENPMKSLLLEKLSDNPSCGEPMPSGPRPSAFVMYCLREWATALAQNPPSAAGGAGGSAGGGAP